jgi:hypothetical protein
MYTGNLSIYPLPILTPKMDHESRIKKSSPEVDNDHVDIQRKSISAAEMETTFDPVVCKRLKLKADFILIPLLSLAYLFK